MAYGYLDIRPIVVTVNQFRGLSREPGHAVVNVHKLHRLFGRVTWQKFRGVRPHHHACVL